MIWHPAPRGLIHAAAAERWTREHPAPDIVVYLWIWSQRDDGAPPSKRDVMRYFGWSDHYARKMLTRVRDDYAAWVRAVSPGSTPGHLPPATSYYNGLPGSDLQKSPRNLRKSPDRARGSTTQHNTPTRTETDDDAVYGF